MDYMDKYHTCKDDLRWYGLYIGNGKYSEYFSPETNAHPAKMSFLLAEKIVKHLEQLGLIHKGDRIIDFMAGTGRTGIVASLNGYKFTGIELEPHFIDMIEANREVLKKKMMKDPDWNIIQGDARKLSSLLAGGSAIVSPPYSDQNKGSKPMSERNDPTAMSMKRKRPKSVDRTGAGVSGKEYGHSEGQIGDLKDIGIVSPPYGMGEGIGHSGKPQNIMHEKNLHVRYGNSEGQVGNFKDIGIVSPPYSDVISEHRDREIFRKKNIYVRYSRNKDNQIGNFKDNGESGQTYLEAMYQVYSEAYKAGISPLVVVTKNPTRNHKLRRLDIDTARLLEMVGYRIVDYHQAVLFTKRRQKTLLGDEKIEVKGRLSFFKLLSIRNGNVAADHEDVIIAVKE